MPVDSRRCCETRSQTSRQATFANDTGKNARIRTCAKLLGEKLDTETQIRIGFADDARSTRRQ
jgi:hypothetical protein